MRAARLDVPTIVGTPSVLPAHVVFTATLAAARRSSFGGAAGRRDLHAFCAVPLGSLALLAMVGYLSAVTQSPITAFVITMEMTANQDLLLPMMAVSVIAFGISRTLCRTPLYDALAHALRAPAQTVALVPPG